jgi:N-acetyl-anhydromuramyl-L-alanine amidase AmpD
MTPADNLWYPLAVAQPLTDHSAPGTVAQRNLVVLHITDGSTAYSAIQTFIASQHPNRVSAHFVIDRDGTVYQLVPLSDTTWHASQVNSRSVGIEHAGSKLQPCTDAQYAASSELVKWVCSALGVSLDREHVVTHNEASPQDGHVGCCTDGLDPDRVVSGATAT